MECSIQILKFGGTSVGSGERIRHVAGVIADHRKNAQEGFPVVVVSAMSGITDQLLRIARGAFTGEEEAWREELAQLKERHCQAAEQAVHGNDARQALLADLEAAFVRLEQDCAHASLHAINRHASEGNLEATGAAHAVDAVGAHAWALYAAAISAWGERLSVLLLAAACQDIGLRAMPVREEVIITAAVQHETLASIGTVIGADPLPEETRSSARWLIFPLIEQGIVPVAASSRRMTRERGR